MPASSRGAAPSAGNGAGRTARTSAVPLPPAARRPAQTRQPPAPNRGGTRRATPTELLRTRPDSSIGATSTNPRLRGASVIEAAAVRGSSSTTRRSIDLHSPACTMALKTLQRLFTPVVLRVVLQRRRRACWINGEPPRRYTSGSVVSAIVNSKTILAEWPLRVLEQLADGATFHCLGQKEFIVYAHESHVSCGIVVLLHGQLEERRPDAAARVKASSGGAGGTTRSRPIRTQTHRLHTATDVLCVMPVLCEDRTSSSLYTRANEKADVAIVPSRWFWEVYYHVAQSTLPASDVLTRYMKDVVAPLRRDVVMSDYFPTSVVLLRSWMWPLLTASDRVKLCRAMELRVLVVGEVLYEEGEYCPYIYFVRRGTLTVVVKGEALSVIEAGACLGEESVLFHEKRNSSVVGSSICELYALHVRDLEHRFAKYPHVAQRLITAAVARQKRWMEEGKTRNVFGLVSILQCVPCLGHSTDAMREKIAHCAKVLTLPQGHVLASVNTPCTSLFVVGRGSLVLSSVVKPAAPTATDGGRPGSSVGRNSSLPPKGRPSSGAKGNTPRGSVPRVSALNLQEIATLTEVRREVRSAGNFLGELCLKPHLWPFDVVCETTVNVWQFDREAILRVLEENRADAQAIEVSRQGISLYRTQRGEGSLITGFDPPTAPVTTSGRVLSATARHGSRTPSPQAPPRPRPNSAVVPALIPQSNLKDRSPRGFGAVAEWSPERWSEYALNRLQGGLAQSAGTSSAVAAAPSRELLPVDREVEKAMKDKVLRLIAVQPSTPLNPADCDISGGGDELQSIIVEQLFLIPTERQPRFIRQVNNSNVRLVTESDSPLATSPTDMPLEEDELRDAWKLGEARISVSGVMRLEDVNGAAEDSLQLRTLATYTFQGAADGAESCNTARSLGENMELSGQVALPPAFGRSRRSTSVSALEDSGGGFMATFTAKRNSLGRSHLVRPPSGLPTSPRSNVRSELISPLCGSVMRPGSSSEPRIAAPARTRPTSVDYNQLNKVGVERSTSVLDRYVKIEDQNYFDDYVKVLPLQQDEIWVPDGEMSMSSLVLLFLHVRHCDYLAPEVMRRCQRPMVKVMLGQRVLLRTPVMHNAVSPHWPVDKSSFITLVRRSAEVVFTVCDADDEINVVYRCALQADTIDGDGGVGQQTMTLTEVSSTDAGADVEGRGSTTSLTKESPKTPRLSTMMLAVTASKYRSLRQALGTRSGAQLHCCANASSTSDTTTSAASLFLQVMCVEGLSHRIEASVTVSFYNGGTLHRLLETSRVLPKTRSPAWPADKAFVKVYGEGGVLTFNLLHRGTVISSAETTVDELVFGGVGLRRLPLLQAQTGSTVMGQLVVCVLGANAVGGTESHSLDWVTHVAVEELRLSKEKFAITPDPFVILRDGAGTERMRTPLAYGVLSAAWSVMEASCLLHCPRLSGSTAVYHLEVCDSDAQGVVGRATITLTERGLAGGSQREIALDPPGCGSVRVRSLCLPVLELPENKKGADRSGGADPQSHPVAPVHPLPPDAPVLLLHVSGCDDLPDGATAEFHTDAVATLTIDNRRFLRTSIREGTTAPRWPLAKASVLLHVPSMDLKGRHGGRHECRFAVYDGVVDEVNRIGQVAVPFEELLGSASHTYPLFPKAREMPDRRGNGVGAGAPAEAPRRRATERTVGTVHVVTLCGRLNEQVAPAGVAGDALDGDAQDVSPKAVPSLRVPYYNPDAAAALLPSSAYAHSGAVLSGTVLLGVSNVCNVLPNTVSKYIHLLVRQGPTPVLSLGCQMGSCSHAEWDLVDSSAALSHAALMEDAALSVELHAVDIVEDTADEAQAEKPAAVALHPVVPHSAQSSRRETVIPEERVFIGRAYLPTDKLLVVGVGEVDVVTLRLEGSPSSGPPSNTVASTSADGTATVSFCIVGNRF